MLPWIFAALMLCGAAAVAYAVRRMAARATAATAAPAVARAADLTDVLRDHWLVEPCYVSLLVLGPRGGGKTSFRLGAGLAVDPAPAAVGTVTEVPLGMPSAPAPSAPEEAALPVRVQVVARLLEVPHDLAALEEVAVAETAMLVRQAAPPPGLVVVVVLAAAELLRNEPSLAARRCLREALARLRRLSAGGLVVERVVLVASRCDEDAAALAGDRDELAARLARRFREEFALDALPQRHPLRVVPAVLPHDRDPGDGAARLVLTHAAAAHLRSRAG